MKSVRRILPYTKQLVLYALYDVLDSENSVYKKENAGQIDASISVFGNTSGFELTISDEPPATVLTVKIKSPREGLSDKGKMRAVDYLADRVKQLLENELKISALLRTKGENIT